MSFQRILVTGGAGFIGSALAHRLEGTADVIVVDNLEKGKKENIPSDAEFVEGDLTDEATYELLGDYDIDTVLHLAGQSSGEGSFYKPRVDFESHAEATFNLLQWCESNQIDRLLYASSMSVYGEPEYLPVDECHRPDPLTYYAAGKLSAEAYIKLFDNIGMNNTIFRLFSVYGPGQNLSDMQQGMVSIYLSFVLRGEKLVVKGPTDRFRDFVHVDDVVDAWISAITNPETHGQIYNLATGRKTTVEELINCILDCNGIDDYPIEVTTGTPGDQYGIYGEADKLRRDLDWSPDVTLSEGVKNMIESYQS